MQTTVLLARQARHIYPAWCSQAEQLTRSLSRVERTDPRELEPSGDRQRDAVHRAIAAAEVSVRGIAARNDDALLDLAARLELPIRRTIDDRDLVALLPPPDGQGAAWVAIYRVRDWAYSYEEDVARWGNWDEKHHRAIRIERPIVAPATRPAIYHYAARALVPVDFVPFLDIDVQGCWEDGADLSALPTTSEPYVLAELFTRRSKIGGLPVLNERGAAPPLGSDAEWMRYAYHLAADFFDCEFGDAASLHIYLSPSTGEGVAIVDSA